MKPRLWWKQVKGDCAFQPLVTIMLLCFEDVTDSSLSCCCSTTAGDKGDPETTLKLVGGMRREGYAVGVFVLALGLGAASTVTQVSNSQHV